MNTRLLLSVKKFVIVCHSEIIQKAVVDLNIDLSSLDEQELHETLSEIDATSEIDWKLKSRALAFTNQGANVEKSDWTMLTK